LGFTSDNFPTSSVLSQEFRNFLRGMAADINMLMKYKPVLDSMYMDIAGGGGASGSGVPFPAMILGDGPDDGVYEIQELVAAHSTDTSAEGINALACNLWETPQTPDFIVPGAGCLDQIFPENSSLVITIQKIQPPTCVPVFKVDETIENPGPANGYQYFFFCPTPLCVKCGAEEQAVSEDEIQRNSREGRQRGKLLGIFRDKVTNAFLGDRSTNNRSSNKSSGGQSGGTY